MSQLRRRSTNTKVFLLSGLDNNIRKETARKISVLGGKYFDLQDFKAICTHVICGRLSRSEKFLGACATGKWILHPDYVHHSAAAGSWLDEEQYEWCDENIVRRHGTVNADLSVASRRWRFLLGDQNGAFTGWKVAVVTGAKRSKVIKRLLISGGAEVFNLKLPVKNPETVANTIGYIFVSGQNVGAVSHLFEYGVLCIRPEFIGDYLIKDPPADPMDYLASQIPQDMYYLSNQDSFLPSSPADHMTTSSSSTPTKSDPVASTSSSSPVVKQLSKALKSQTVASSSSPLIKGSHRNPRRTVVTSTSSPLDKQLPNDLKTLTRTTSPVLDLRSVIEPDLPPVINLTSSDEDDERNINTNKSEAGNQYDNVTEAANDEASPVFKQKFPESRRKIKTEKNETTDILVTSMNMQVDVILDVNREPRVEIKQIFKEETDAKQTSTPSKGYRVELSQKSFIKNMSPITKYFKPILTLKKEPQEEVFTEPCQAQKRKTKDQKVCAEDKDKVSREVVISGKREPGDEASDGIEKLFDQSKEKPRNSEQTEHVVINAGVSFNEDVNYPMTSKGSVPPKEEEIPGISTAVAVISQKNGRKSRRLKGKSKLVKRSVSVADYINNQTVTAKGDHAGIDDASSTAVEHAGGDVVDRKENLSQPGVSNSTENNMVTHGNVNKRKLQPASDLHSILQTLKRQKVSNCEWQPPVMTYNFRQNEDIPDAVGMPTTTTDIINSTLEDHFTMTALHELNMHTSFKYYPQPEILGTLMNNILVNAVDTLEANYAYHILCKILRLHPPITEALQGVYLQAMAGAKTEDDKEIGAEWNMIKTCVGHILTSGDALLRSNNILLFKIIIQILQQNLQHHLLHQKGCQTNTSSRHMLLRIMWSPSYHIVFNTRCRELMELMSNTIDIYRTMTVGAEKQVISEVLQSIVWLVAMTSECCRLLECGNMSGVRSLSADKTSAFIHEIARRLDDGILNDRSVMYLVLTSLQLPWLCVGVCQQILNLMDDYLITDHESNDAKCITLSVIVSQYLYLLPRFHVSPDCKQTTLKSATKQIRQCEQRTGGSPNKCLFENTDINKDGHNKRQEKVNKKNGKGETPLHIACIKNKVTAVKQLLQIPGVDVNMKDNAGWTPLHEACNHGHLECVKELLKFVPSKKMDHYFNQETAACKKVDLLACNDDSITPLHDAVMNSRLEVCRVLLQHGGPRLLTPVTCYGFTPLNLAETDEMCMLLSSFSPAKRRLSDSQESMSSQGSSLSVDLTRKDLPSDILYDEVTQRDGTQIYSDTTAMLTYVYLVKQLIKYYIAATDLDNVKFKYERLHNHRRSRCHLQGNINKGTTCRSQTNCDGALDRSSAMECNGAFDCDSATNVAMECNAAMNCNSATNGTVDCLPGVIPSKNFCDRNPGQHVNDRPCVSRVSEKEKCEITDMEVRNNDDCDIRASNNNFLLNIHNDISDNSVLVTREDMKDIKRDLCVVRDISRHMDLFKSHLFKLCHPNDKGVIESELSELYFLVEHLQGT